MDSSWPSWSALYAATMDARPPAVSLALGVRPELVARAHDAGILFLQQVHTVDQALRAAEAGVDVVIAQGGEAGGFGGVVGALALVPQVVDAVHPIPVAAAGGIADGRVLAAALVLGAAGVNVGTRLLASKEAAIAPAWRDALLAAASEDAVNVEFADAVFPPGAPDVLDVLPRVRCCARSSSTAGTRAPARVPPEAARELVDAILGGRGHEFVPFTGQSAGLVRDVLPASEIVRRLVAEAEEVLGAVAKLASAGWPGATARS